MSPTLQKAREAPLMMVAAAAAKSLQLCLTLCDPIDGSPPGPTRPWDSPGKNTGVGCHFLLQYMKVKSESEVAPSCPTLSDPMDCSLPGSSIHGVAELEMIDFTFTFHFHALEKAMATHSSVLAWRIPGTGEPGGLPSMGSHRVRHN